MSFEFIKYSAAGNDFILIDIRKHGLSDYDGELFARVCERRNGIGADGILLVGDSNQADVRMAYINADGREVEMCGNGLRALSHYVFSLMPESELEITVETMQGKYTAKKDGADIKIAMPFIQDEGALNLASLGAALHAEKSYYLKVGVPHAVFKVKNIAQIDLETLGPPIRDNSMFENGTNVNIFTELGPDHLAIRTYERGVGETLACGTGAVATAIAYLKTHKVKSNEVSVLAKGGELKVSRENGMYYLTGPAYPVYVGSLLDSFAK